MADDTRRLRLAVRDLEQGLQNEMASDRRAVLRRGALVAHRPVVSVDRGERIFPRCRLVEGQAHERRLGRARALRDSCHPAERHARGADPSPVERKPEGAHGGRDVLIEALRHLVAPKCIAGFKLRHDQAADVFAGATVLFAVGEEEGFERDRALSRRASQFDPAVERDEGGREVAEPFAMLPPTVPATRTCTDPKRRMSSPRSGSTAERAAVAS
jgi:hypothetical protein